MREGRRAKEKSGIVNGKWRRDERVKRAQVKKRSWRNSNAGQVTFDGVRVEEK